MPTSFVRLHALVGRILHSMAPEGRWGHVSILNRPTGLLKETPFHWPQVMYVILAIFILVILLTQLFSAPAVRPEWPGWQLWSSFLGVGRSLHILHPELQNPPETAPQTSFIPNIIWIFCSFKLYTQPNPFETLSTHQICRSLRHAPQSHGSSCGT